MTRTRTRNHKMTRTRALMRWSTNNKDEPEDKRKGGADREDEKNNQEAGFSVTF